MQQVFSGSWSLPSEFGTPFMSGELTTDIRPAATSRASRKSERVALEIGAGLRQRGGTGVGIQIVDLSTDGFRATTHLQLEKGADVWLRLPGLEPLAAKVIWADPHRAGMQFERPIHPAVFELLLSRLS